VIGLRHVVENKETFMKGGIVYALAEPEKVPGVASVAVVFWSFHEGGEFGYSLSHAYGAAFDNPDLIVACVVGDGEAETGPLATSWHSNKFLNPIHDGAVLPIYHNTVAHVALRKSPYRQQMFSIGNFKKIIFTSTLNGQPQYNLRQFLPDLTYSYTPPTVPTFIAYWRTT